MTRTSVVAITQSAGINGLEDATKRLLQQFGSFDQFVAFWGVLKATEVIWTQFLKNLICRHQRSGRRHQAPSPAVWVIEDLAGGVPRVVGDDRNQRRRARQRTSHVSVYCTDSRPARSLLYSDFVDQGVVVQW